MNDDLFGRIDRVLHECDARQLPPLTAAIDPAGSAEHVVVTETATGRVVEWGHENGTARPYLPYYNPPPVRSFDEKRPTVPVDEAPTSPKLRRRLWPWRRR